jgi:hypothetical protein
MKKPLDRITYISPEPERDSGGKNRGDTERSRLAAGQSAPNWITVPV